MQANLDASEEENALALLMAVVVCSMLCDIGHDLQAARPSAAGNLFPDTARWTAVKFDLPACEGFKER